MMKENKLVPYHLTEQDYLAVHQLKNTRYSTWEWNYGFSPKYAVEKKTAGRGMRLHRSTYERGKGDHHWDCIYR